MGCGGEVWLHLLALVNVTPTSGVALHPRAQFLVLKDKALTCWLETLSEQGRSQSGSELGPCGHVLMLAVTTDRSKNLCAKLGEPMMPSVCNFCVI